MQSNGSDSDRTLDILARPSLKKITGPGRTTYSDPASDPILLQAELIQNRRYQGKKSETKKKIGGKGVVTKPKFVRLSSKSDMPSGRERSSKSRAEIMNEIASPLMEKEFTFTGYDIMADGKNLILIFNFV